MNTMNFNDYQQESRKTAIYPGQGDILGLAYVTLGLAGESGEVAEKVKKLIRDSSGNVDEEFRRAIAKELGDILWYASQLATELNIPLNEIAQTNLDKLQSRQTRGVLNGSGDNR